MATIRSKETGSKSIQVVNSEGSRLAIGIGKVGRKEAESYRYHIEQLESCSVSGQAIPAPTAKWLTKTKPRIRRRLADIGLIELAKDESEENVTLDDLLQRYLEAADVKERTIDRYRNQTQFLLEHFGTLRQVRDLKRCDGDRFLKWLRRQKKSDGSSYSANYIHKIVKTSRQILAFAVKNEWMEVNVLDHVKAPERIDDERDVEITQELAYRMMYKACPKYRLVIAFARFGGLRCPSELAGLSWSDIDWSSDRFVVHSPKTAHCGKESRQVPIFAELRPVLEYVWRQEGRPDGPIFPDIDANTNLRTETQRLLKRVGEEKVQRFYQNCRSSRQTELEVEYPLHVVCKWMGNSESVAKRHYLKVRDRDFERAATVGVSQGVQNTSESTETETNAARLKTQKAPKNTHSPGLPMLSKYTREDSNLQPPVPKTGGQRSALLLP
ncbi:MAG: hypothetical protein Fues2KO_46950 [Fuerstiella sp.]